MQLIQGMTQSGKIRVVSFLCLLFLVFSGVGCFGSEPSLEGQGGAIRGGIKGGLSSSVTVILPVIENGEAKPKVSMGTAVAPHLILLAAHSLVEKPNFDFDHNAEAIIVLPKIPNIRDHAEQIYVPMSQLTFHRHPSYPDSKQNDITLPNVSDVGFIRLPDSVQLPNAQAPQFARAALACNSQLSTDSTTGWREDLGRNGYTEDLWTADVEVNVIRNWYYSSSGGAPGETGDSGGPMYTTFAGQVVLYGVYSAGSDDYLEEGNPQSPTSRNHFARIDNVWEWLEVSLFCLESGDCTPGQRSARLGSENLPYCGDVLPASTGLDRTDPDFWQGRLRCVKGSLDGYDASWINLGDTQETHSGQCDACVVHTGCLDQNSGACPPRTDDPIVFCE
ncbi:MAG: trypsin-like serine protease [Myxococcales bacterium]|nr:MAG: trypsin-like serine protease [Myxococcales bacterium]